MNTFWFWALVSIQTSECFVHFILYYCDITHRFGWCLHIIKFELWNMGCVLFNINRFKELAEFLRRFLLTSRKTPIIFLQENSNLIASFVLTSHVLTLHFHRKLFYLSWTTRTSFLYHLAYPPWPMHWPHFSVFCNFGNLYLFRWYSNFWIICLSCVYQFACFFTHERRNVVHSLA